MTIEIERNVPLPEKGSGKLYPFDEMGVGDSFLIPNTSSGAAWASIVHAKKRTGFTFTTRKIDRDVRVWRIA